MREVLVTGGTSGIGLAIAQAFAKEGSRVTATGLTREEALSAADADHTIQFVPLDITNSAAIGSFFEGRRKLDVLVNAAGTIERQQREHDPEVFAHVVAVNLTGTMRMCSAARPLLAASQGCVINMASMLSYFGSGFVPAYSASKGGVVQLTRSLAIAWAVQGIRVNAIAPGWIETAMTAPLIADPARRDAIAARTPLGRWGKPQDIAGAALFLASPAAAYITGVVLPVDGGYSVA